MSYSIAAKTDDDHHVHSPGGVQEEYRYDSSGNRVMSALPAVGHVQPDHAHGGVAQEVSYTYDADGNRVVAPAGEHVPHTALDVQRRVLPLGFVSRF